MWSPMNSKQVELKLFCWELATSLHEEKWFFFLGEFVKPGVILYNLLQFWPLPMYWGIFSSYLGSDLLCTRQSLEVLE